jgi:hypothetical protein
LLLEPLPHFHGYLLIGLVVVQVASVGSMVRLILTFRQIARDALALAGFSGLLLSLLLELTLLVCPVAHQILPGRVQA